MGRQVLRVAQIANLFVLFGLLMGCLSDETVHAPLRVHLSVLNDVPVLRIGSEVSLHGNVLYRTRGDRPGGTPALPTTGVIWNVTPAGAVEFLKFERVRFLQSGKVSISAELKGVCSNELTFNVE